MSQAIDSAEWKAVGKWCMLRPGVILFCAAEPRILEKSQWVKVVPLIGRMIAGSMVKDFARTLNSVTVITKVHWQSNNVR